MSGSTNAGDAFDLTVLHRANESTYAGIVRLVEGAQRSKAPMSRLADRFAMVFLAITVVIAAVAQAIRYARSLCSSLRRRAPLFSRYRLPSFPTFPGRRDMAS
jgi:cation transport ATPase